MNRVVALLILFLLSGCLGTGPTALDDGGDAPEPDGADDAPSGGMDDSAPSGSDPVAAVNGLDVGLEGIDCTLFTVSFQGPSEPASRRAGDGFDVNDGSGVSFYYVLTHACRSAVLGGDQLGKDVWLTMVFIRGTPENGSSVRDNGYLLETFTNWQPLVDAWSVHGVEAGMASYTLLEGATVDGYVLGADGASYTFQPLGGAERSTARTPLEYHLYVGNGTQAFGYLLVVPEEDSYPHAGLLSAEGGFLSEVAPPAHACTLQNGINSVEIKKIQKG